MDFATGTNEALIKSYFEDMDKDFATGIPTAIRSLGDNPFGGMNYQITFTTGEVSSWVIQFDSEGVVDTECYATAKHAN